MFQPSPNENTIYLTAREVADTTGLSEEVVRGLCNKGVLIGAKREYEPNGPWQIPAAAVEDWKRKHPSQKKRRFAVGAMLLAIGSSALWLIANFNDVAQFCERVQFCAPAIAWITPLTPTSTPIPTPITTTLAMMPEVHQFNIAVAEFPVVDANDKPVESEQGKFLAQFVSQQLPRVFNNDPVFGIWPYTYTGIVTNSNIENRPVKVHGVTADVIFYGKLIQNSNKTLTFVPMFFVDPGKWSDFKGGEEIIGSYELGGPIPNIISVQSDGQAEKLTPRLYLLVHVIRALRHHAKGEFIEAKEEYKKAISLSSSPEITKLFIEIERCKFIMVYRDY
jgi:hypothetical protein